MRKVARALITLVLLAAAGCVSITSEPNGADVYRRGQLLGKTPHDTEVELAAFWRNSGEIRVELPGYVIDSVRFEPERMHFILRRVDSPPPSSPTPITGTPAK